MTVPGIGPIISSATVAAIGMGDIFGKGRDFGAWLGLVPKQMSTGGPPLLGRISKRGEAGGTCGLARKTRCVKAASFGLVRSKMRPAWRAVV